MLSSLNLTAALYGRTLGGIQQCFGSIYNNCYTCAAPLTLCNSMCYCNNSFYWNGTTCSECYSSCSICNGPLLTDCLLQTITNNNVCSTGYFFHSCESFTYYNCLPCDSTCLSCEGPYSSDCLSCTQNATLQSNKSCRCSQGYSGSPPLCKRNNFSATISIKAINEATISFSEPLADQLSTSNFSLFLSDITQLFSITMINSSSYLLSLVYEEEIIQNRTLKIIFSDILISQSNSLLSTLVLSTNLVPCQFLKFGLSIKQTEANSLLLSFYIKPGSPLNQTDIKLFISNLYSYSFTLVQYSISSYLINVTYDQNIGNNCTLTLIFNNPIYSICNDSLPTLEYNFNLTSTVLSYEDVVSYQSEQTATTVTQSLTIGSLSLSLLNFNFITLWNFLNTIQLLCYIRLSSISLPPKFNGQLKGLKKFNMAPNIFGYFLNESDYTITNPQFVDFGFKSSLIFFNCGSMISIGIALFAFFLVCVLAKLLLLVIPYKLISLRSTVDSLIQSFKYGRVIRYLIQAYLDLLASAFISLIIWKKETITEIVNLTVSLLFLVILAGFPIFSLKITMQKKENNNNGIMSLYGTLFSEFSNTEGFSSSFFYFFFFLRRIFFMIIILFIPNTGLLKVSLNLIVFLTVFFI